MEQKLRRMIKDAMVAKTKDKSSETMARYQTLKNILETAQKAAKEKKIDTISDSLIIDAAKKEIKQLRDLLQYCNDNAERKAETEFCITVAEALLPTMASEFEITAFVQEHSQEAGNIGAMMKLLKSEFGDSLDGKTASRIVKSIL
jgi:uncharacterized protein YqeY